MDSVGFLFVFNKVAHLSVREKVEESEVEQPLPTSSAGKSGDYRDLFI